MAYKLIVSILTFIIFFTPIAFGTVHLWSIAILRLCVLSMFFLYVLRSIKRGFLEYQKTPINVFFLALLFCMVLELYFKTTYSPHRTYTALITTAVYFALFHVTANTIRERGAINSVIFNIGLAGFLMALVGILQKVTKTTKIYWIWQFNHKGFFSSFINNTHFACYISMTALLGMGYVLAMAVFESSDRSFYDKKIRALSYLEKLFTAKVLFMGVATIFMIASLFLSGSRAGASSFLIAVLFFFIYTIFGKRPKRAAVVALITLASVYMLLNWLGLEKIIARLNTIFFYTSYGDRLAIYSDGFKMFMDHPFLGYGMGSFSHVFPAYRTVPSAFFYKHLHSDIFQFLIENGLIVFIAVSIPFLKFLAGLVSSTNKTRDEYKYYIVTGILAVFFYLLVDTAFDFGLRINAISSLCVILMALSVQLSIPGLSPDGSPARIGITVKIDLFKDKKKKFLLYKISAIIFLWLSVYLSGPFISDLLINKAPNSLTFNIAAWLDPSNDRVYFKKYKFIMKNYEDPAADKDRTYIQARDAIENSIRLSPYNTTYMITAANMEFRHGNNYKALEYFKKAAISEPRNPFTRLAYSYGLFRQAIIEKDDEKKDDLLKEGLDQYSVARNLKRSVNFRRIIKSNASYLYFREALKREGVEID